MKKYFFVVIAILYASALYSDWWVSTDWSASTAYDTIVNLNGKRQPGNLILDAPDIWNWDYMCSLQGALAIHDLLRISTGEIFAATGDSGYVYKSENNGLDWIKAGSPFWARRFNDLMLIDTTIYAGGVNRSGNGKIYYTHDCGTTWSYDGSIPAITKEVFSLGKCAGNVLAGKGITGADIFISYDNGQTFVLKQGFSDIAFRTFCAVDPSTIVGGTGPNKGYIVRSSDCGESWIKVDSLSEDIIDMKKDSNGVLLCCTKGGEIYKSINGGTIWDSTANPVDVIELSSLLASLNGSIFIGGRASGGIGVIYRSLDGGTSWERSADIVVGKCIQSVEEAANGFLIAGTNIDASIFRAGYFQDGYIISKPFYTGTTNGSTQYGVIQWIDSLVGQSISIWVRTAQDSLMLTALPWGVGFPPVLNGDSIVSNIAVNDGDSYIQYYIKFQSEDAGITPYLKELSIEYSVDTIGPNPIQAIACDGENQLNGIDDDDYVIMTFSESTNGYEIPNGIIDSILKLSPAAYLFTWGTIDTSFWQTVSNNVILNIQIDSTARLSPDTTRITINSDTLFITDPWKNAAFGSIPLTGSFDDTIPPTIISAFASDSIDSIEGIDSDDFVKLVFDQVTDTPQINSANINTVLHLSGGHTWGNIDTAFWSSDSMQLTILLDTLGTPTIAVGDTIYPDTATIQDINGNGCYSPIVLGGTFGDYGPVIASAIAYDGLQEFPGIDSDDYVILYFNEKTNGANINENNIDAILSINHGQETWIPTDIVQWNGHITQLHIYFEPTGNDTPSIWPGDTIYPDSTTITDIQGRPCIHPVILEGTFNPGVEEEEKGIEYLPRRLNLSISPNPAGGCATILYDIPLKHLANDETNVTIDLYDLSGRRIKRIHSGTLLPGSYTCILNDKNIKQGIYFIRLVTPQESITRKLILLR